jgi:2-polyprenyl-6-methoxyphenol hydroxylase-like FAD-dependent oxidoreductase
VRVGIVGCGTAGPAAALLLARDGHEVELFERAAIPRAIGAGILIQPLAQQVLGSLQLADELEACSTPVRRIDGRTRTGRRVMDFGYGDVLPGVRGWGVNRGALFRLLWDALRQAGITTHLGFDVDRMTVDDGGWRLHRTDGSEAGPFDLVVGADGARSRVRHLSGLAGKDVGYPYGAVWCVIPDPDRLNGDVLVQRYGDTRRTLGLLPTGVGETSIFWSVPTRQIAAVVARGVAAWQEVARPYAGELAPLVDRVGAGDLLAARYRDVVVRSPVLVRRGFGLVLLGDAAHAMSPQLGLGANLALADAWTLAASVRRHRGDLAAGLEAHAASRRAHVRWYTWCSRLMTPVFQSDLVPIGWARDLLLEPVARIPWVRRQFVTTLLGVRTSPWTEWRLP